MLRSWPSFFGLDVLHPFHNVKTIQAMVINIKIVRLMFLYHITDKISHTMQIQPPSWFCHGCEVLNQNLNEHAYQNKAS